MADLTSQANRLNDVEINNNKPVTSSVFRRLGSSINYLLDLLNVEDGATLGGSTDGINVFTPVDDYSYSYTFTNSDVGVPKTLFTFQGGGDRPLYFFNRSSDFRPAGDVNFLPISDLITQLGARNGTGTVGQPVFIVTCGGIELARTTRGGSGVAGIVYSKDILHAPAGTNTITVTLQMNLTSSLAVSGSAEYLAL